MPSGKPDPLPVYLLKDGAGLFLRVKSNGAKTWVFRYYWHGKQEKLTFGKYRRTRHNPFLMMAELPELLAKLRQYTCIRAEDGDYVIGDWGGDKVPFLFATNGRPYLKQLETKSEVWFRDVRDAANLPKALQDWIGLRGLLDRLDKNIAAASVALAQASYDLLHDPDGLKPGGTSPPCKASSTPALHVTAHAASCSALRLPPVPHESSPADSSTPGNPPPNSPPASPQMTTPPSADPCLTSINHMATLLLQICLSKQYCA
jgi:hypothetical protein